MSCEAWGSSTLKLRWLNEELGLILDSIFLICHPERGYVGNNVYDGFDRFEYNQSNSVNRLTFNIRLKDQIELGKLLCFLFTMYLSHLWGLKMIKIVSLVFLFSMFVNCNNQNFNREYTFRLVVRGEAWGLRVNCAKASMTNWGVSFNSRLYLFKKSSWTRSLRRLKDLQILF